MQRREIESFLTEPMRMAQVASVSQNGNPLLGSLWFLFEDGHFWFSSHPRSPLVAAAQRGTAVAVIVDDFTPPDHIRQIRIRGAGAVHDHDPARVGRIYERYLGSDRTTWPEFFQARADDLNWALWTVAPDSGVATINPDFRPVEARWAHSTESPLG